MNKLNASIILSLIMIMWFQTPIMSFVCSRGENLICRSNSIFTPFGRLMVIYLVVLKLLILSLKNRESRKLLILLCRLITFLFAIFLLIVNDGTNVVYYLDDKARVISLIICVLTFVNDTYFWTSFALTFWTIPIAYIGIIYQDINILKYFIVHSILEYIFYVKSVTNNNIVPNSIYSVIRLNISIITTAYMWLLAVHLCQTINILYFCLVGGNVILSIANLIMFYKISEI